jgi:putative ABC transport system substrate-binding protein
MLCAWGSALRAAKEAVVVLSREAEPFRKCEKAARAQLESDGWTVKTIVLDDKSAVDAGAALITVGTEATAWGRGKGSDRVFCMVADLESAGLAGDGAVAGVLAEIPAARQMAILKQALPNAKTVGVLFKKGSTRGERWVASLRLEAGKAGLKVEAEGVEAKEEVGHALDTLLKRGIDVLWTMPDGALYDANTIKAVLHATLEAKVPVFGFSTPVVKAGALVGVGIAPETQGKQAAALLMARTKAEASRSGQTVEPEFEVTVNQVVAERLGIKLPPELTGKKGD